MQACFFVYLNRALDFLIDRAIIVDLRYIHIICFSSEWHIDFEIGRIG